VLIRRGLRGAEVIIRYPWSFYLMLFVIVVTATLTVAWNVVHVLSLVIDIGAITVLRSLSHWERGRSL
jgi:hypothetical protein